MSEAALLPMVRAAAARRGIRPELMAGLIEQESGWNPSAVSRSGAIGLTQLMPATARELGVDPRDPVQAIKGGIDYFSQQLDRFNGNEQLALAAYNAGPGAVEKYGGIPPYKETQNYVSSVLSKAARYGGGNGSTTGSPSTAGPSAAGGLSQPAPTAQANPFQGFLKTLIAGAMDPANLDAPAKAPFRAPIKLAPQGRDTATAANNVRLTEGLLGNSFGGASGFDEVQAAIRGSRMAGDVLADVFRGAPSKKPASSPKADPWGFDPAATAMTGLLAGLFAPRGGTAPQQSQPEDSMNASGTATGGGAGRVIEYLTGDKSHSGYDPSHGGGNYHEHLAFGSKAERDRAAALLKSRGIQIGSMNDGKHAPTSYHYSDQAFDVPASQVPVGQEPQLSAKVREILRSGGFAGL